MHWLDEMTYQRMGSASIGVWPFDDAIQQSIIEHVQKKIPALDKIPGARFAVNSYQQLLTYFNNAGIPKDIQRYAGAQVIFETNNFKSHISKSDFNLSGIKWINKPYQNATQGTKSPEGNYYARFKNYNDWAKDYKRILSIGGAKAPINATSLQDFVNRLAANHYFTSNPSLYYTGVSLIYAALPGAEKQKQQLLDKAKQDEANKPKHNWFKDHPIWTGVIVATGGVIVIKAVSK